MTRLQLMAAWLLSCAALGGCRTPEEALQTIVLLDAKAGARDAIARGAVFVKSAVDNSDLQTVLLPPEHGWPIKLVLVPKGGDASRRFALTVTAMSHGDPGEDLFVFDVSAGFVAGRTRTLKLSIADSCVEPASPCRFGCGPLVVSAADLGEAEEVERVITCKDRSGVTPTLTGGTSAGTGGSDAEGGDTSPGMINVGSGAGRGGAGGAGAPAAGSGGRSPQPEGGKAGSGQAGDGANPPPVGAEPCAMNVCGEHGKCSGAGDCACDPGYVSAGTGQPCLDVDECAQDGKRCGAGVCQNLPGDFSCECTGDTWPKPDRHGCAQFQPSVSITPAYNSGVPCEPQVAFFGASPGTPGKGLALWITGDSSTQALWSAGFDPVSGWTIANLPVVAGVSGLDSPRLALNPTTGDGFATWLQNNGTTSEVRYAVRKSGRFGAPQTLTTLEGKTATFLSAALSGNGDGYATWTEIGGDASSVRSQVVVARFLGRTTQTWLGTTTIAGADGSSNAAISRIAVDGQGRALLVWTAAAITDASTPNFIGTVYASRYDPTTPYWRPLGELDSLGSGLADVSFEASGKGMGIWQRATPASTGLSVAASTYTPGTGWGNATSLSTTSDPTIMLPRVSVLSTGNAFAMWTQQAGSALNVWGSVYDAGAGKWSSPAIPLSPQSSTPPPYTSGWGGIYFDLTDVAADAVGGAVGVFSDFSGMSRVIRAVHVRAGSSDLHVSEVKRDTTPLPPSRVEVGLDTQGSGALIWDQPLSAMPAAYQVFVSRID